FLPPTAAAARFLLAAYERWWAGREPSPAAETAAARPRDGGCGWVDELGHPLRTLLSHGPSHTENGFSSEDILMVGAGYGTLLLWCRTMTDNNNTGRRGNVTAGWGSINIQIAVR
ncbi:hypothetical protein GBF38_019835, partial [Nibea albiflora]